MIDINFILNGGKKNAKKVHGMRKSRKGKEQKIKKEIQPLRNLSKISGIQGFNKKTQIDNFLGKPKGSIIGDKITKQQKKVFKKSKKQKSFMPIFGDWDGDKVINGLDCRPRNKKKHTYWKPMHPEKQRRMRNDLMEKYYQDKGYYKYGGPDRMQADDLAEAKNRFSTNPVKKYITINNDRITPEQRQVLQSGKDRFNDTDKDGVIDGLDCKPNDETQHMAFKKTTDAPVYDYPESYGYKREYVEETPEQFMKEAQMTAQEGSEPRNMSPEEYERLTVTNYKYPEEREEAIRERNVDPKDIDKYIAYKKEYMGKLTKAIKDPEEKVPMGIIEYDRFGEPIAHEGRHRAIAARDAGMKKVPYYRVYKQ